MLLLFLKPNAKVPPKWLVLPIGYGIPVYAAIIVLTAVFKGLFRLSSLIADVTLDNIGHEINLEPLLMTIVGGYLYVHMIKLTLLPQFRYVATNQSKNRRLFLSMLQKVSPYPVAIFVIIRV